VEVFEDTKIPNAATIKIVKQDHTLGNMLRAYALFFSLFYSLTHPLDFSQLLATPHVLFAGYKVPHPLHPYFQIKIQTDGTITPQEALEQAATSLITMVSTLEGKFKREFTYKGHEADGSGVSGVDAGDPYGGGAWSSGRDYMDF